MHLKLTFTILIAGMGILLFYYSPDTLQTFYRKYLLSYSTVKYLDDLVCTKLFSNIFTKSSSNEENAENHHSGTDKFPNNHRLFTAEELSHYDGGADSSGLYLAILGEVFDVEKGAQHYKPGAGYAFFTGRDATRAYVTGDFSDEGLSDDISNLEDSSLMGIEDWITFYRDEYSLIGKVIGRYYDKNGNPTAELNEVLNRINKAHANKYIEEKEKEVFPPCNSEWSKEIGSRVWCTKKSGGIDRNWVGVPRKFFKVGYDPRCVCVRNSGPPSSSLESGDHSNRGDLDHPTLVEYPSCDPDSESCMVDHP